MKKWSDETHLQLLSPQSYLHFNKLSKDKKLLDNKTFLRQLLLDFIADFANWDNSNNTEYLSTSRSLTQAAHEALGGEPGTHPLVVDPFAGGGSIPLEALRIGADAFASDLNPIPVLINKVQLEYIPKYGKQLADEVRKWGAWIKEEAEKELAQFYPPLKNPKPEYYTPQVEKTVKRNNIKWTFKKITKETPIAYLWARTVVCEGPRCGSEIPLMRGTYLAKKGSKSIGLKIIPKPKQKRVDFEIVENIKPSQTEGTIKRGSATCPCCGFVTPVTSIRRQLKAKNGGANSAQLFAIVTTLETERSYRGQSEVFQEIGRFFRLPHKSDMIGVEEALHEAEKRNRKHEGDLSLLPNERTPTNESHRAVGSFFIYGIDTWGKLYSQRQNLSILMLQDFLERLPMESSELSVATKTILAFGIGTIADHNASVCTWRPTSLDVGHVYGRQALPMSWDFAEVNPSSESTGSYFATVDKISRVVDFNSSITTSGSSNLGSATNNVLPDDSASFFFTDPPYYDSVPYAELSDLFYVWHKRMLSTYYPELLKSELSNKTDQAIVWHPNSIEEKREYEIKMQKAMEEGRRIVPPSGIGVIVFAHKSTSGWESQLKAMVDAGWIITASWALDTELGTRINAMGTASLVSSIHLVCRPRENQNDVGDWRDVLRELPKRIHEWMPRLADEGVVGADAIFACLGPALEIFSRYSSVEKPNGNKVELREYLEQVWAAVSQEALSTIFKEADAKGFEQDARITAMWLWTITAGKNGNGAATISGEEDEESESEDGETSSAKKQSGYTLEYDDARLIAQGLGARLEELQSLIEVKGDKARLRSVEERTNYLFGEQGIRQQPQKKKKKAQLSMFENVQPEDTKYVQPELKVQQAGKTVLDRLHQAMLLFSTGRTEALKRFLVEDGAGSDERFWKLAQAFTALYPKDTDERRWVEAVQTYKKSLGF